MKIKQKGIEDKDCLPNIEKRIKGLERSIFQYGTLSVINSIVSAVSLISAIYFYKTEAAAVLGTFSLIYHEEGKFFYNMVLDKSYELELAKRDKGIMEFYNRYNGLGKWLDTISIK